MIKFKFSIFLSHLSSIGIPPTSTKHFGVSSVMGLNLDPIPADINIALICLLIAFYPFSQASDFDIILSASSKLAVNAGEIALSTCVIELSVMQIKSSSMFCVFVL